MSPIDVARLSRKYANKNIPSKIVIENYADHEQFLGWCANFDTSNLLEVTINMTERVWSGPRYNRNPEYTMIGWVPPSVKKLTLNDHHLCRIYIPEGVEDLTVHSSFCRYLELPSSIKKLTLGQEFCGSVRTFPSELRVLRLLGWDTLRPYSSLSLPTERISNLPDTIRFIELGPMVRFVISRWPNQLERLIMPRLDIHASHAEIPPNVEVELTGYTSIETDDNSTASLSDDEYDY